MKNSTYLALARFILLLLTILMVAVFVSCKSKKTIVTQDFKERVEKKSIEDLFTGSETSNEISKKTTKESSGGSLKGSSPVDLNADSTVIKASGDGVELSLKIKDGNVSYEVESKPTEKVTEEIEVKRSSRDTTVSTSENQEIVDVEESNESIKIRKKTNWWWLILIILGVLGYVFRKRLRGLIPV